MAACTHIPEQKFVPGTPARVVNTPVIGWDTGADSAVELDGDVRVRDEMPKVVGVIWGFTQVREMPNDYTRVTHGWLFSQGANGAPLAQVVEAGITRGGVFVYEPLVTQFEIRRVAGQVTYLIGDALHYTSRVPLVGLLSIGAHAYATGDYIP